MAERNAVKPRVCSVCRQSIETTADGIKKHAVKCKFMQHHQKYGTWPTKAI